MIEKLGEIYHEAILRKFVYASRVKLVYFY